VREDISLTRWTTLQEGGDDRSQSVQVERLESDEALRFHNDAVQTERKGAKKQALGILQTERERGSSNLTTFTELKGRKKNSISPLSHLNEPGLKAQHKHDAKMAKNLQMSSSKELMPLSFRKSPYLKEPIMRHSSLGHQDEKFVSLKKRPSPQRDLSNERRLKEVMRNLPENVAYDIDDTDEVVKHMIRNYERLSNTRDVKSYLALKNIRLRHPLFQKISAKAFSFIVEQSCLYKLKTGQFIYREGIEAAPNIYFIMYGQF